MRGYYGRYHETIKWTVAKISYTNKDGKRKKEVSVKFENVACYSTYEMYKTILKRFPQCKKPYVHEIVETYYWEE